MRAGTSCLKWLPRQGPLLCFHLLPTPPAEKEGISTADLAQEVRGR